MSRWIQALQRSSHIALWSTFVKWIMLGGAVGVLAGTASAFFLHSLDAVTDLRMKHGWLLFLLPLGGALVSYLYLKFGRNSAKGNNLILEQIADGQEKIPLRMAPLVLFGTLVTHLFGGSAGREGTAVQMGGSLAEWLGERIKINAADRKILLMCGISGGFGSIFGTPLAGTIFGLEVLAIGLISHRALLPCFTASFVGDLIATRFWGAHHIHYTIGNVPSVQMSIVLKVVIASILFGLVSLLFSELTHALKRGFTFLFKNPMLKSAVGGLIIIALVAFTGTRDYLGLGLPLIQQSFEGEVSPFAFIGKLLFTSVTLGAGFQGGEVTPLFAIGATMGHTLAGWLGIYAPFLAALGFIAVFCGATNTPIACFVMGIELFGSQAAVYLFIACIVSYLFSGHSGIYTSQRIGVPKSHRWKVPEGTTLAAAKKLRQLNEVKKDEQSDRDN
ncbi:voltage-gated chloride channel family protein [Saccharibacillus sp. JS10]|uniref:voltage-gated chloride channel family protein n=1 Tax=Saccharibacillus sp. JS10 TaxID=2950552 RepID=UPI002109D7E8|nr:voltage-gated chloride channel family protein [Saccharibacillus sp. JS10]MCQ4086367.1 voltage-gated chloride channel family protein [Saccharibacillus sp. JS10]